MRIDSRVRSARNRPPVFPGPALPAVASIVLSGVKVMMASGDDVGEAPSEPSRLPAYQVQTVGSYTARVRAARIESLFRRHMESTVRLTRVIGMRRPIINAARNSPPPLDMVLATVRSAAELAEMVSGHTAELVAIARQAGASWSQIGAALGITKQAAHERFRNSPRQLPMRFTSVDASDSQAAQ
jgi:hypothetical protein